MTPPPHSPPLHLPASVAGDPLAHAFLDRLTACRDALRAEGRARFLPGSQASGEAGPADRWIDTALPEVAGAALAELLGRALLDGADPDRLRRLGRDLGVALRDLDAEVRAALAAWHQPPEVERVRALVTLDRLDTTLRARISPHLPAPENARPWPVVDTSALPDALAKAVWAGLDEPDVLVLEGDNRRALRHLAALGRRVDAVLEDPPYDTGNPHLPYRDAWPRGAWEASVREHLQAAREVLTPAGLLAMHIDEHRAASLNTLVREVFGDGHLGTMVWDKRNPKGDAHGIATQHERIEWATRSRAALTELGGLRRPKRHAEHMLAAAAALVEAHAGVTDATRAAWRAWVASRPELSGGQRAYRHLDDRGRVFRTVSMAWPNKRRAPDAYFQPLLHPVTGRACPVPARGWRNPPGTMQQLADRGLLHFGADHRTQPTRRYFLDEMGSEPVPSVWPFGGSDDARLQAMGLAFAFGKPVDAVLELLDIVAKDPTAVVFDGFAGSGSTAEAVLQRNAMDGGRRRVVLAEIDPDVVQTILVPRLTRVLTSDRWKDGEPVGSPRSAVVVVERMIQVTRGR